MTRKSGRASRHVGDIAIAQFREKKMDGEYYLGQIITTAFGIVPKDFAPCNGQLLPVNVYQALFALLGTRYGGDGIRTFALPDLRGRTPVGAGTSVDAAWQPSPYEIGTLDGAETVVLKANQVPAHTHDSVNAVKTGTGDLRTPVNNLLGVSSDKQIYVTGTPATKVKLAANAVNSRGGGTAHDNMQPFQVLSFCIAINGIFPPRP